MTSDELKAIDEIRGTAGFRVIEYYLNKRIDELKSVMGLDGTSQIHVGIQALAKQKATQLLIDFLSDLNINYKPQEEVRKTYE